MTSTPSAVTFLVKADSFPAGWHQLKQNVGARHGTRRTEQHRSWARIDGRGFTIWLSAPALVDSATDPPTWAVKMETLSELTSEGRGCWEETHAALSACLRSAGIEWKTT